MAEHLELGKQAEQLAATFLQEKGYTIVARNFRFGKAEIDLIVKKGIFLVFVEVKARKNVQFGMPETAVGKHKIALVKRAADFYVFKINWQQQIRFDIVSVTFVREEPHITHFEDAFY